MAGKDLVQFNQNPDDHPDYRGWVIASYDDNGQIWDVCGAYRSEAEASRLCREMQDEDRGLLGPRDYLNADNTGCA